MDSSIFGMGEGLAGISNMDGLGGGIVDDFEP